MIVHKLLAKSPADRFASAIEIAQLLEGCLAHVQQPGTVPLPKECAAVVARRSLWRRWLLIFGGSVVAGVFGLMYFKGSPPVEPQVSKEPQPPIQPLGISTDSSASWDAGEETISPLRSDFNKWQRNAEQIWEDTPP
jgi:hypothetical protein